jgi:hypothetical protein
VSSGHNIYDKNNINNYQSKKNVHFGTENIQLFTESGSFIGECFEQSVKSKDTKYNLNDPQYSKRFKKLKYD